MTWHRQGDAWEDNSESSGSYGDGAVGKSYSVRYLHSSGVFFIDNDYYVERLDLVRGEEPRCVHCDAEIVERYDGRLTGFVHSETNYRHCCNGERDATPAYEFIVSERTEFGYAYDGFVDDGNLETIDYDYEGDQDVLIYDEQARAEASCERLSRRDWTFAFSDYDPLSDPKIPHAVRERAAHAMAVMA